MSNYSRKVVLDTETTGINKRGAPYIGHRIIEIGAIEIINRRLTDNKFHVYINPNQSIDLNAFKIHGINNDFLEDKPLFKDIASNLLNYIDQSELIIHNSSFDIGFLDQEFSFLGKKNFSIATDYSIIDTLKIARSLFPGKKNTLDALCSRYKINISHRNLHSAIIDAHLLGKLYLSMTGGQQSLSFLNIIKKKPIFNSIDEVIKKKYSCLKILKATEKEQKMHQYYLDYMKKNSKCLWD